MIRRIARGIYRRISRAKYRLQLAVMAARERVFPPTHAGHPVPPPRLRQRTTLSWLTVEEHIREGQRVAKVVEQSLQDAKVNPDSVGGVLDFGCGCGRVLRHLYGIWPNARLFGIDVDSELIDWTSSNLQRVAHWRKNKYEPPTDLEGGSFSVIYAFSVFTHLDGNSQSKWLGEFHRLLKPDGVLLITVVMTSEDKMPTVRWDHHDTKGMAYRYRTKEVANRPWVTEETEHSHYIDVQHTEAYCRNEWSPLFEVSGLQPDVNNGQTLVIMRKQALR